jgi:hypothetical protein
VRAAVDDVEAVAILTVDVVVARVTKQSVGVTPGVILGGAIQDNVVSPATPQSVVSWPSREPVVAGAALDDVVVHFEWGEGAVYDVVSRAARQAVITVREVGVDQISAAAATDAVVAVATVDDVVPAEARDDIGAIGGTNVLAVGGADDGGVLPEAVGRVARLRTRGRQLGQLERPKRAGWARRQSLRRRTVPSREEDALSGTHAVGVACAVLGGALVGGAAAMQKDRRPILHEKQVAVPPGADIVVGRSCTQPPRYDRRPYVASAQIFGDGLMVRQSWPIPAYEDAGSTEPTGARTAALPHLGSVQDSDVVCERAATLPSVSQPTAEPT